MFSMDEHKEEGEFVRNCEESVKSETLGGKVDVPLKDSNGDANTAEGSDSGVCNSGDLGNGTGGGGENHGDDGSGTETGSLEMEDSDKDDSVSDEKTDKADVEKAEETGVSVANLETENEDVGHDDDDSEGTEKMVSSAEVETREAIAEPMNERGDAESCDDAESGEKLGTSVEAEIIDDTVTPETERRSGEVGSEVNVVEKAKCDVEVKNGGASDVGETEIVDADKCSDAAEKVSLQKSDDNDKMDVDSEDMISKVEDEKVCPSRDEQKNLESETLDVKPSEHVHALEEPDQVTKGETAAVVDRADLKVQESSSAAETCSEEPTAAMNQKEEKGEAMEIDSVDGEHVKEVDQLGGDAENAGEESTDASTVETQDVPAGEADQEDSNVEKSTETDKEEQRDKDVTIVDVTDKIISKDSTDPGNPIEDASTGNIQEIRTDTGNVSGEVTDTNKEVSHQTHNCGTESPASAADHLEDTCDADLVSSVVEENREEKDTVVQRDVVAEQKGDANEAPDVDMEMAEKLEASEHDDGTDSITKTKGVKRKADDVLGEDSSQEVRKTISVAKVSVSPSHPQKPSFKIGACIARAASQMAGPPSVLKGSTFGDDLSVDNFLLQLQSAATDPAQENVVSEIAAGFFLDYRSSVVSLQPPPDKVSGKKGRQSNSSIGGTEAFEFEEMSDTYWTDRVIHNGGEEQIPPAEKGDYQIVPVELKPAQIQRSRRPYTKRKHAENNNSNKNSLSASDKSAGFDENAPAELIMNFSEMDTLPSEISLNKMFRHFGPIRESKTEVDRDTSRARVVFKKCADAEVAYNSAGRFNIFGTKVVNYGLSYTITEPFKIQPYIVSLGEEDRALCLPSES
ncbi:PREDICTED: protein starmaker isoform X2 [Tarenaya hassleriana]|uniref:protein starmaker isoform X2 n=1 Tax=Tarenaya hassleriana TaxID=28532 RepID=UPI00053C855B|nr:PREDICTED: protein starmaker isoform X2 [Tarenaya hassleriana]